MQMKSVNPAMNRGETEKKKKKSLSPLTYINNQLQDSIPQPGWPNSSTHINDRGSNR